MSVHQCPLCDFTIDTKTGCESEGFKPGIDWEHDVPADWFCPDCGVRDKVDFVQTG